MKTLVLNPFNLDADAHTREHSISFPDESLTVQADKDQADINNIVRQFGLTHELPYGQQIPVFDDFTDAPNDYHAAMNFVIAADDAFMELPAEQRSRFDNDAGKFLQFVSDDSNYDEAVKLGFVPKRPSPPADGLPLEGDAKPSE